MNMRNLTLCAALLLLCCAHVGLADDGEDFVAGEARVGARYGDYSGEPGRVGEYVDLGSLKDTTPELELDLFGGTGSALFDLGLRYRDAGTKSFSFGLDTRSYLSADFDYTAFVHNLDHDHLQNMQAREGVPDGEGGYNPGGKQIYHTDNDPLGRYFLQYERFLADVRVDLPFLEGGRVDLGYADRHKSGWKQAMTIDHCAFCHVESGAKRVDQTTRSWHAGLAGTIGAATVTYDFDRVDYADAAGAGSHRWKQAIHPVSGGMGSEFASRLIFEDVTLPYGAATDNEKTTHEAAVKVDLKRAGSVKGTYSHALREAAATGLQSTFDAGAVGWVVRPSRDLRVTARFLTYEVKADDRFVDLPAFRAGDAAGGNLDFDWTRISAANRRVNQGDLALGWKAGKGRHLKASWRYRTVDRDAMAQNQTSYVFDGVNNGAAGATLVPSLPYANETTSHRLKLRWDARVGRKGNYNLAYTYTTVDQPFMNPTAMCEESIADANSAHVDAGPVGRLYYFQRQRYGNGTSEPSDSHRFAARGSYRLSSRTSVNAFLTYQKDKNDELNSYELDRDMLTPGLNLWTAPADNVLFTLGWTNYGVESNANLCPPIFDG